MCCCKGGIYSLKLSAWIQSLFHIVLVSMQVFPLWLFESLCMGCIYVAVIAVNWWAAHWECPQYATWKTEMISSSISLRWTNTEPPVGCLELTQIPQHSGLCSAHHHEGGSGTQLREPISIYSLHLWVSTSQQWLKSFCEFNSFFHLWQSWWFEPGVISSICPTTKVFQIKHSTLCSTSKIDLLRLIWFHIFVYLQIRSLPRYISVNKLIKCRKPIKIIA